MPTFDQYLAWRVVLDEPGVELDLSDAGLTREGLDAAEPALTAALAAMERLEAGAIANADEQRMVGHYWLRDPDRAPQAAVSAEIRACWAAIERFTADVREGRIAAADGQPFRSVLLIGIGGSALGPQLLADALGGRLFTLDNTDPTGIADTLAALPSLAHTLVLVISKSGGTAETRNGMLELQHACRGAGLDFARQAVAVTGDGSQLHRTAVAGGWLATFPMWDWVGGRTSVLAAVGLLPGALLGLDWRGLLRGAAAMDAATRRPARANPAALLAHAWHAQTGGRGRRAMVMLPYADRLVLLSRYLQQLVMESLGKRHDRQGREVDQGITVYGNKGSTDQHAYVQQLRDGLPDFFATFVRVLREGGDPRPIEVEPGATSGDCLDGFYQGTRTALAERGRASVTLTLDRLDAPTLGAVIALYERTVGLYAELIDVNAYHQPGVEAGKLAARAVLALQRRLVAALGEAPRGVAELAAELAAEPLAVWQVARRLAAQGRVRAERLDDPAAARFARA
jgi:glucose-6-phosphate isomerase